MKRSRSTTWWGWEHFEITNKKNDNGNTLYQCNLEVGKDDKGQPIKCCALIAYCNTPTPFKNHLKGPHREFHANK
jgi:hypothetical protein